MTAVFVHGVPENTALWWPLRRRLTRSDVVTLALPGFGVPVPDGFGCTKDEYARWLVTELERLAADGPIDLVGHDWGGGFAIRAACLRPDLLRSWVSDAAAAADEDFRWHEYARIWQTPGAGEAYFADLLAQPRERRARLFMMFGVPAEEAIEMEAMDETMAASILALYRSATTVGADWAPDLPRIAAPGLVLLPSADDYIPADLNRRAAARAGASTAELPGLGHWWMLQDPALAAAVLEDFWATVPAAAPARSS